MIWTLLVPFDGILILSASPPFAIMMHMNALPVMLSRGWIVTGRNFSVVPSTNEFSRWWISGKCLRKLTPRRFRMFCMLIMICSRIFWLFFLAVQKVSIKMSLFCSVGTFGMTISAEMALLNFNLAHRDTNCRSHLTGAAPVPGVSDTTQMAT